MATRQYFNNYFTSKLYHKICLTSYDKSSHENYPNESPFFGNFEKTEVGLEVFSALDRKL